MSDGAARAASSTFAAVSSGSPTAARADGAVVPWVDRPAPDQSQPAPTPSFPATARPCTPSDLVASAAPDIGAALGNTNLQISFRNRSASACLLDGYPGISAVDAAGRRVPLAPQHGSYFGDPGPVADIGLGQSAAVNVSSGNGCAAAYKGVAPGYRSWRLTLPSGGEVAVQSPPFVVACGLSVSRFGVPADRQPPASGPPPSPLTATIAAPASVRAGETLRYTVTLANPTDAAVGLQPCPAYQEFVGYDSVIGWTSATKHDYLNCDAVHEVPAHGSVTFAMQLTLPTAAPRVTTPGSPAKFGWSVDGDPGPRTGTLLQVLP